MGSGLQNSILVERGASQMVRACSTKTEFCKPDPRTETQHRTHDCSHGTQEVPKSRLVLVPCGCYSSISDKKHRNLRSQTGRDVREMGFFATTLLASVERCSTPETSAKSAPSPPRCSPAWSGVQDQRRPRNRPLRHHAARQRGAVFNTRDVREMGFFATTLLASVERCSTPETSAKSAPSPPRCSPAWSGVQDAGRSGGAKSGAEHGSTLASSVVAEDEDVA